MKNLLKRGALTIAAISALLVPMAMPVAVSAQANIENGLCTGANLSTTPETCSNTTQQAASEVDTIITTVINIFSLVVGVVSVIMIIIGGLKYITSGGDSGNVSGAKNTILYAIIGLVVVALAQVIVKFVLGKVAA